MKNLSFCIKIFRGVELKLLWKCKKNGGGCQVGLGMGGSRGGGWSIGRVWLAVMLGVGGDVGYGGCEPRIEGIVQCTV